MVEIVESNVVAYLAEQGVIPRDAADAGRVRAKTLGWGVSNVVIRVEPSQKDDPAFAPMVVKQSRPKLRVAMEWLSRVDRIFAEIAALEALVEVLPEGAVPRVIFSDRENYLFAMTSAPEDAAVWKAQLLEGKADVGVAAKAGTLLGRMHSKLDATRHPALLPGGALSDTEDFDQLRVDPFYRVAARSHPEVGDALEALGEQALNSPIKTFVHADFSPKNLLVHRAHEGLTAVDFETAHAGDPAFDLGFFHSHLLAKSLRAARQGTDPTAYWNLTRSAWHAYHTAARDGQTDPTRVTRSIRHAAGCLLARVDGKSPVDYLDARAQVSARRFAAEILRLPAERPIDWESALDRLAHNMQSM